LDAFSNVLDAFSNDSNRNWILRDLLNLRTQFGNICVQTLKLW
jgi:hypothetical protein